MSHLVHLLTGDDTYSIQERLQQIKQELIEPEWETFNLDAINGDEVDISRIVDSWQTPPFGGAQRLIIVDYPRQPDRLFPLLQQLHRILESGTQTSNHLLLVTTTIDKRRKETKELLKLKKWVQHQDYSQVKSYHAEKVLYPWLDEQARREGKQIARSARAHLLLSVGVDKNALNMALQKLFTYIGDRTVIEETDVHKLVQNTESNIFLLLELLAQKKQGEAVVQMNNLLLREPPQKIIATLATSLRATYRVKRLHEKGVSSDKIAEVLKMNPWVVKQKNIQLWEHYKSREVESHLRRLLELDARSKRSKLSSRLALEMWLAEFVG